MHLIWTEPAGAAPLQALAFFESEMAFFGNLVLYADQLPEAVKSLDNVNLFVVNGNGAWRL